MGILEHRGNDVIVSLCYCGASVTRLYGCSFSEGEGRLLVQHWQVQQTLQRYGYSHAGHVCHWLYHAYLPPT